MNKSYRKFKILIIILIISAACSGGLSFFYTLTGSGNAVGTYGTYTEGSGMLEFAFRYCKDIVCLIICGLLFAKIRCIKRSTFFVLLILFLGSVRVIANTWSYQYFMCGVREYLYAITMFLLFEESDADKTVIADAICKGTTFVILANCAAQLAMAAVKGVEVGTTRLPGLANSGISLGYAMAGCAIAVLILHFIYNKYNKWQASILIILTFLASVFTGTRVAMIVCLICMFVFILLSAGVSFKTFITIFPIIVIIGSYALNIVLSIAGRGALGESASGRFEFFEVFFSQANSVDKLIGTGIGVMTNNAANMNLKYYMISITDSTFALVLVQFGIIGMIVFVVGLLYVILGIWKSSNINGNQILFIGIIIILIITMIGTNIFEQNLYSFIIVWALEVIWHERASDYEQVDIDYYTGI